MLISETGLAKAVLCIGPLLIVINEKCVHKISMELVTLLYCQTTKYVVLTFDTVN